MAPSRTQGTSAPRRGRPKKFDDPLRLVTERGWATIAVNQRRPMLKSIAKVSVESVSARSLFSPATGFIRRGGFDWTCTPYVGCTFGCTYCYAAFLPQNRRP